MMRPVENGGSRGEKRPNSEQTTAGSQSCKQSLLSGCVLAPAEKLCVCAQSMSGGGNTELLMLTLARSFSVLTEDSSYSSELLILFCEQSGRHQIIYW